MRVIIPMAGNGSRFSAVGFKTQKFLLPVDTTGRTMIQEAVSTLNAPAGSKYTFVTRKEYTKSGLIESLESYDATWHLLNEVTNGPATTAFLGLSEKDYDEPILVSNSDQILQNWDCQRFLDACSGYDGGVLTYTPSYPVEIGDTDKNSYVEVKDGNCVKFAEKVVLSDQALIGVHYFRSGKVFMRAYERMVKEDERAPNGEFYLSLMYNSILAEGGTVCAVPLQKGEKIYLTGEPYDYYHYINTVTYFGPQRMSAFKVNESGLQAQIIDAGDFDIVRPTIAIIWDPTESHPLHGVIYSYLCDTIQVPKGCKGIIIQHETFHDLLDQNLIGYLSDMYRGWCIGDFTPSVFRTQLFELGVLLHKKGEVWPAHVHDHMTEYNHILTGSMLLSGTPFNAGDSFVFPIGHPAVPEFLTDCLIVCIKTPSVPTDKRIL